MIYYINRGHLHITCGTSMSSGKKNGVGYCCCSKCCEQMQLAQGHKPSGTAVVLHAVGETAEETAEDREQRLASVCCHSQ